MHTCRGNDLKPLWLKIELREQCSCILFALGRVTAPVLPASMSCCVLPISIAHDCIKILSMLGVIIGSFEPAWFHIYAYIYKIIEPIQCKVKNVNNQMIGFENKGTGNYSGGKLGVEFSNLSPFFVVVVLVLGFFWFLFLLVPFLCEMHGLSLAVSKW